MSAPGQSWCDPAGASPVQVRSSVRLVASVAWPLATVVAKRTQRLHGVWDRATKDETSQGPRVFIRSKATCAAPLLRGAVALPGSKATSRAKGSYRNLGDLVSGRQMLRERDGPHREGEEPKPMMHGREKSDPAIVAMNPANKAKEAHCGCICGGERSGVGGAKGGGQGEYASAKHALDSEPGSRVTGAGAYTARPAVIHSRQEPCAGKPHAR